MSLAEHKTSSYGIGCGYDRSKDEMVYWVDLASWAMQDGDTFRMPISKEAFEVLRARQKDLSSSSVIRISIDVCGWDEP